MNLITSELTEDQFQKISELTYRLCGINLKEGKQALVRARLIKRLRALGISTFDDYIAFIESNDGQGELTFMVDVMTTNKTHFFREPEHFNYLVDKILAAIQGRRIRIWSAACSSGEEPFSIGMLLRENVADLDSRDVKILATDISNRMLEKARRSLYSEDVVRDVPPLFLQKYFTKTRQDNQTAYQVKTGVRNLVHFAWLNLMDKWPMKGSFNVIFCRNVMIYFDRQTQQRLIQRFYDLLEPQGYLFVGHSEGLSAVSHKFRYVKPAIYQK